MVLHRSKDDLTPWYTFIKLTVKGTLCHSIKRTVKTQLNNEQSQNTANMAKGRLRNDKITLTAR